MRQRNYRFLFAIVILGFYGFISCNNIEEQYKDKYAELRAQIGETKNNLEQKKQRIKSLSFDVESCKASILKAKDEYEQARVYIDYDKDGLYTVQVESWRSEEKSIERAMYWRKKGYTHSHVYRDGNEVTGDVWFSVRLGRVSSYQWSKKLHRLLQIDHDFTAVIYKIHPNEHASYNMFWN